MAKLIAFTTDHLQRMISNNPGGALSARIMDTEGALDVMRNFISEDLTKLGLRKARKMTKKAFRKALPNSVAKIMGAVVAQYGPDSPEVIECFPHGRTIFSICPDDEVKAHLQVIITGVTARQADLGAPLVAQAAALSAAWVSVYAVSESSSAVKSSVEADKNDARRNLQLVLYHTLLKIADMYPRQPEKLHLYMQQSLLETHAKKVDEEDPPPA